MTVAHETRPGGACSALTRRRMAVGALAVGAYAAGTALPTRSAAIPDFAEDLQSLGWWMRRTTGRTIPELMPYYERTLGLPLIRAWEQNLVLLWAGEDQVFEVKTDDNPARVQSDLLSAALIPVFRVHDLERWRQRMQGFGHSPAARSRSKWGETLFYLGPDRLMIGFERRDPGSPLASDQRALVRWRAGPFRLGELPPLPDTLHHLSRAIRHVADVPAMAAFYRDRVGLQPLGVEGASALFALGPDTVLEIAPGGTSQPEPDDRSALCDSVVLRVHELDLQRVALRSRGVRLKGDVIVKEGTTRLQFVPDPEGWIFGIEERGTIRARYIDDVEADRRWRNHIANGHRSGDAGGTPK